MKFSTAWNKSKKPGKQRLYRYNAPLHIKRSFVAAHLSKELKQKYNKRSMVLRKGDKVKIVRGQFASKTGSVEEIDLGRERIIISGIEVQKKDGTKTRYPIHASNLIITELVLDDKKRQKIVERKKK